MDRGFIYLNKTNFLNNLLYLKKLTQKKLCLVVKANAYGHGYKAVTKEIESLVHGLSVATTEEALSVRKITKKSILCMEGPYDLKELNLLIRNQIDLVIHSHRQINFLRGIKSLPREIKVG